MTRTRLMKVAERCFVVQRQSDVPPWEARCSFKGIPVIVRTKASGLFLLCARKNMSAAAGG
jgi:hypothetical protein